MKTKSIIKVSMLLIAILFSGNIEAQYTKVFNEISGATSASTRSTTKIGCELKIPIKTTPTSRVASSSTASSKTGAYSGNSTSGSSFNRTGNSTTSTASNAATSNEARRAAMRKEGIPTSQQPYAQSRSQSGMEYRYNRPKDGGGNQTKAVQDQTLDHNHKKTPHWEAGKTKIDDKGKVQNNKHGRAKLSNNKSKVEYPNKKEN